jgi:hypothetical protein
VGIRPKRACGRGDAPWYFTNESDASHCNNHVVFKVLQGRFLQAAQAYDKLNKRAV